MKFLFAIIVTVGCALGSPLENEITLFGVAIPPPVSAVLTGAEACGAALGQTAKKYCNRPEAEKCQSTGYFTCYNSPIPTECPADRPYCIDPLDTTLTPPKPSGAAVCSATPDTGCSAAPIQFNCLQASKILPDPIDCKKYYYCNNLKAATVFNCPDGYAFDPSLPDVFPCRYTANAASSCIKADCSTAAFGAISVMRYASLPTSLTLGQIAVKCFGSAGNPIVFRTGAYTSLASVADDTLLPTFNIVCPSEGFKLADDADPTKYNVCVREIATGQIRARSFTCFGGFQYKKDKQVCEP